MKKIVALKKMLEDRSWHLHQPLRFLSWRQIGSLVFVCLLLAIFLRAPYLLLEPRLWAEEGTQFLQNAYNSGFLRGIFFLTRKTGGYFLLACTLPTTIAAHLFPIEYAAYVTTYFALLVQSVCIGLILFGTSYVWNNRLTKVLAAAVTVFAPSVVPGVWLNTANVQVYCGLISLCILCENTANAGVRKNVFYVSLLIFAGLSGPYTAFIFAGFLLKALLEGSRSSRIQFGAVAVTAAIQAAVFIYLAMRGELSPKKFAGWNLPVSIVNVLYHQYLVPVLGLEWSSGVFRLLGLQINAASVSGAVLIVIGIWTVLTVLARANRGCLLLAVSGLSLSVLTTIGSVGGVPSGHYAFLPSMAFLFLIVGNIDRLRGPRNWIAMMLIISSLAFGLAGYRGGLYLDCRKYVPPWPEEVAKWRRDSMYLPRVWPADARHPEWRWIVRLKRHPNDSSDRERP